MCDEKNLEACFVQYIDLTSANLQDPATFPVLCRYRFFFGYIHANFCNKVTSKDNSKVAQNVPDGHVTTFFEKLSKHKEMTLCPPPPLISACLSETSIYPWFTFWTGISPSYPTVTPRLLLRVMGTQCSSILIGRESLDK